MCVFCKTCCSQQTRADCSVVVHAGYFDAPGTKQAALGTAWGQGIKTELPVVTLVFSAVDGLKAMRVSPQFCYLTTPCGKHVTAPCDCAMWQACDCAMCLFWQWSAQTWMACVVPLMLWTAALGGSFYDDAKRAQTFLVFPLVPFADLDWCMVM